MDNQIYTSKVTVAIPAYKSQFLGEAIESVLAQTYSNIELHIVNDCSPQDIDSVVKRYCNDKRVHYHVNPQNIGGKDPVRNWNKCLEYATGEFFALLCDDDVYASTFIENMLKLATKYPYTNVFRARVKIVGGMGELLDYYPSAPEWENSTDYMWAIVSSYRRQTISEFMYRTSYIKEQGGYIPLPKAWCSDHASVISLAKKGGIATCNVLLVQFRMSGVKISTGDSKNILEKVEAHVKYTHLIESFLQNESKDVRQLILKARKNEIRNIMSINLTNATWHDYLFLYRNRNSKKYEIPSRCFLKAIYGKIVRKLKRTI